MISLYRFNHRTASGPAHSACLAAFDSAAGPQERARLERLRRDEDRLAYRVNHGFLRLVLASASGRMPEQIAFEALPGGKPICVNGPHFNMSHAGGLTVVAVSFESEVGVDVEVLSAEQFPKGSVSIVAADEDRHVLPYLSEIPVHAETILWSIKEAALKLTGDVMIEPDRLAVARRRDGSFQVGPARAASAPVHESFVRLLQEDDGYVLSLAAYAPLRPSQVIAMPESWHGPPSPEIPVLSRTSLVA